MNDFVLECYHEDFTLIVVWATEGFSSVSFNMVYTKVHGCKQDIYNGYTGVREVGLVK